MTKSKKTAWFPGFVLPISSFLVFLVICLMLILNINEFREKVWEYTTEDGEKVLVTSDYNFYEKQVILRGVESDFRTEIPIDKFLYSREKTGRTIFVFNKDFRLIILFAFLFLILAIYFFLRQMKKRFLLKDLINSN